MKAAPEHAARAGDPPHGARGAGKQLLYRCAGQNTV